MKTFGHGEHVTNQVWMETGSDKLHCCHTGFTQLTECISVTRGLFLRLRPEEVEGFLPLLAVPATQPEMVGPPPASTGGAKSQPLTKQNRSGGQHLWRNAYGLSTPHAEICKQLLVPIPLCGRGGRVIRWR